jgi:hypothetical protein
MVFRITRKDFKSPLLFYQYVVLQMKIPLLDLAILEWPVSFSVGKRLCTLFKYCKLSRYSRNELSISGVQLMFLLYASLDFKKQEGIVSTDKLQQKEFPFKLTHKISKNTYFRLNFRFLFKKNNWYWKKQWILGLLSSAINLDPTTLW